MTATFWVPFAVKALTTAFTVVSASALAEALGPFWGALIASLPVSAGPAYVFLSLRHDEAFMAASALSSFAANAATGVFLIVYGTLSQRLSAWPGLVLAVAAWLAGSVMTQQVAWTPWSALGINLVVYTAGFALLKVAGSVEPAPARPVRRRWSDLPVRAGSVAAFVCFVVAISSMLGPRATGIAAVFPISLISLIVIVRPRIGGAASSLLAASALRSMLGFGLALLALHLAIPPLGVATALVVALAVSVCWSGALLLLRTRRKFG